MPVERWPCRWGAWALGQGRRGPISSVMAAATSNHASDIRRGCAEAVPGALRGRSWRKVSKAQRRLPLSTSAAEPTGMEPTRLRPGCRTSSFFRGGPDRPIGRRYKTAGIRAWGSPWILTSHRGGRSWALSSRRHILAIAVHTEGGLDRKPGTIWRFSGVLGRNLPVRVGAPRAAEAPSDALPWWRG